MRGKRPPALEPKSCNDALFLAGTFGGKKTHYFYCLARVQLSEDAATGRPHRMFVDRPAAGRCSESALEAGAGHAASLKRVLVRKLEFLETARKVTASSSWPTT